MCVCGGRGGWRRRVGATAGWKGVRAAAGVSCSAAAPRAGPEARRRGSCPTVTSCLTVAMAAAFVTPAARPPARSHLSPPALPPACPAPPPTCLPPPSLALCTAGHAAGPRCTAGAAAPRAGRPHLCRGVPAQRYAGWTAVQPGPRAAPTAWHSWPCAGCWVRYLAHLQPPTPPCTACMRVLYCLAQAASSTSPCLPPTRASLPASSTTSQVRPLALCARLCALARHAADSCVLLWLGKGAPASLALPHLLAPPCTMCALPCRWSSADRAWPSLPSLPASHSPLQPPTSSSGLQ